MQDTLTAHAPRIQYTSVAPKAMRAFLGLSRFTDESGLEHSLLLLVKIRASYLNGCAYCVDMHTKDARLAGESEQRLYALPVWRETPFFTPRERAALAWTDAITEIGRDGVSDELFTEAREEFSEEELVNLTFAVITINGWNRLAISLRAPVGSYVAGSVAHLTAETFADALPRR